MPKVLISDNLAQEGIEILEKNGLEVVYKPGLPYEELLEIIPEFHALIIRSGTKVTKEVIERAQNLKVIGRAGTGLDNVDISAANEKGIVVMNVPGGNTLSAAEHTLGLLFSLARKIPQAVASLKTGKWEKKKFMGVELNGKVLGIIGLGRIGSIVADRAIGLKMKVIAYDPFITRENAEKLGVELVELEELFKKADFITIHTPLTKDTYHLIDEKAFSLMKDGVYIINCARGGIVDEMALYNAMISGKVAGAALDVFEEEPVSPDHPLLKLDNFIGTPHLGASTVEAQKIVAIEIAKQIVDYLLKGIIKNAVNVPSLSEEALKQLKPALQLVEKMGSFITQLGESPIKEINITYKGEIAKFNVKPLTLAMVKSILYPILKEDVNYVNALYRAKERNIKVMESKMETSEDFTTLISVELIHENDKNVIEGTFFGKNEPRIVKINGFRVDALPEGYMLYIYHEDRPGVIGSIGTILGNHNLNIERMYVGHDPMKQSKVILIELDTPANEEVLGKINELPTVYKVKAIEL